MAFRAGAALKYPDQFTAVMRANAGIHGFLWSLAKSWIPAFAGMTVLSVICDHIQKQGRLSPRRSREYARAAPIGK
ncbi:MAG: hypothetical protein ABI224_04055, partial [Acetobacteraceae bacterium]